MTDTWLKALVLACIFGTVLLATEAVINWIASNRADGKAINLRLKLIGQGKPRDEALRLLRRREGFSADSLPPMLRGLVRKLQRTLVAAQVTSSYGRMLLSLVLAPVVIFFLILGIMLATGVPVGFGRLLMVACFAVGLGFFLPLMILQFKANRTRRRMEDQFPVALDVFVRGLRAGHPIAAALDLLTVEMPDPIGSEFGLVVDEVTYGAELRDALQEMADRWDMDDIRMFVVSLSVQSETGGNLAEILESLSKVIRERASMMMKVRALSAEGRMTAWVLTALPVLAFSLLFLFIPSFYLDIADDPAFLPGFGFLVGLYAFGFYIIRRMVNLEV